MLKKRQKWGERQKDDGLVNYVNCSKKSVYCHCLVLQRPKTKPIDTTQDIPFTIDATYLRLAREERRLAE